MKIKICGITNLEDALHAASVGADALGFNFYERSPRYISPDAVREIGKQLPSEITKVGVFVNADVETIRSLDETLDLFQLHGDESPEYVSALGGEKVIKALRIGRGFDLDRALDYSVKGFLLDTATAGYGGSGTSFDWDIAVRFKEVVPEFYLAGGLTPDNVAEAIARVDPYGVDVCSGVESMKGKKDHEKVEAFIRNARAVV